MSTESRFKTGPGPGYSVLNWRTVDIVVAAVIGVSIGVVFWLWGVLWTATEPLFVFFPPAQAVIYGMWMLPGVLGGLVIRKAGAALLTSVAAASVSILLGVPWGVSVIVSGVLQGLLPELVFLAFAYRRWNTGVAVLAGVAAGISPAIKDNITTYVTWPIEYQLAYAAIVLVSAGLIAGVGGRLLTTALARTDALAPFPSARG
ncbi:energy-coupling factor transport system substrate-specific component [Spinactinospora alkalitolerans]|uniref:Energy-coupling factor transport system substrate-specific component n=1 Tax=Spinactinospora alkalitolerans TaxID=687207 RepID=A0A852TQL8_9ACTN|nr:ECF transporter S component [Spinactinospora alkalitolerans]NYE45841.1 energy-coupling factor transport system substrate-specific component [Spinactinospora alkalitolerans]